MKEKRLTGFILPLALVFVFALALGPLAQAGSITSTNVGGSAQISGNGSVGGTTTLAATGDAVAYDVSVEGHLPGPGYFDRSASGSCVINDPHFTLSVDAKKVHVKGKVMTDDGVCNARASVHAEGSIDDPVAGTGRMEAGVDTHVDGFATTGKVACSAMAVGKATAETIDGETPVKLRAGASGSASSSLKVKGPVDDGGNWSDSGLYGEASYETGSVDINSNADLFSDVRISGNASAKGSAKGVAHASGSEAEATASCESTAVGAVKTSASGKNMDGSDLWSYADIEANSDALHNVPDVPEFVGGWSHVGAETRSVSDDSTFKGNASAFARGLATTSATAGTATSEGDTIAEGSVHSRVAQKGVGSLDSYADIEASSEASSFEVEFVGGWSHVGAETRSVSNDSTFKGNASAFARGLATTWAKAGTTTSEGTTDAKGSVTSKVSQKGVGCLHSYAFINADSEASSNAEEFVDGWSNVGGFTFSGSDDPTFNGNASASATGLATTWAKAGTTTSEGTTDAKGSVTSKVSQKGVGFSNSEGGVGASILIGGEQDTYELDLPYARLVIFGQGLAAGSSIWGHAESEGSKASASSSSTGVAGASGNFTGSEGNADTLAMGKTKSSASSKNDGFADAQSDICSFSLIGVGEAHINLDLYLPDGLGAGAFQNNGSIDATVTHGTLVGSVIDTGVCAEGNTGSASSSASGLTTSWGRYEYTGSDNTQDLRTGALGKTKGSAKTTKEYAMANSDSMIASFSGAAERLALVVDDVEEATFTNSLLDASIIASGSSASDVLADTGKSSGMAWGETWSKGIYQKEDADLLLDLKSNTDASGKATTKALAKNGMALSFAGVGSVNFVGYVKDDGESVFGGVDDALVIDGSFFGTYAFGGGNADGAKIASQARLDNASTATDGYYDNPVDGYKLESEAWANTSRAQSRVRVAGNHDAEALTFGFALQTADWWPADNGNPAGESSYAIAGFGAQAAASDNAPIYATGQLRSVKVGAEAKTNQNPTKAWVHYNGGRANVLLKPASNKGKATCVAGLAQQDWKPDTPGGATHFQEIATNTENHPNTAYGYMYGVADTQNAPLDPPLPVQLMPWLVGP